MAKPARQAIKLRLRVKPRARRAGLTRAADGSLIARVAAAPVDGRANAAVIALLAASLRVPKSALAITSGAGARTKRIRVTSDDIASLRRRLAALPGEATAGVNPSAPPAAARSP